MAGSTLCRDLPKTRFEGTTTVKKNGPADVGLAAAGRWLTDQANGWCEAGLCSSGKCRGVIANAFIKPIRETAEEVEFKFGADISCECPPGADTGGGTAPQPAAPAPLTPDQAMEAVRSKFILLTHYNELIAAPVPEPELSAFIQMREAIKQWLLGEISSLTTTPAAESEFWAKVRAFGIAVIVGTAIEKILEGLGAKVAGKALGPLAHILLDPSEIGGVDVQVVDSLDVKKPPNCYRIIWFRTKYSDELIWGPIRIKIEKIPC